MDVHEGEVEVEHRVDLPSLGPLVCVSDVDSRLRTFRIGLTLPIHFNFGLRPRELGCMQKARMTGGDFQGTLLVLCKGISNKQDHQGKDG